MGGRDDRRKERRGRREVGNGIDLSLVERKIPDGDGNAQVPQTNFQTGCSRTGGQKKWTRGIPSSLPLPLLPSLLSAKLYIGIFAKSSGYSSVENGRIC